MAATYTSSGIALTFGANKSISTIFNDTGSGVVIRIYRILILNNQTVAIANGVLTSIEIRRVTASTGGSNLTVVKHDTSSSTLPAEVYVKTGATDTVTDRLKQFYWSTDEPAATGTTLDEWECIPVFNYIWESGYGESTIDPIVLREGEGIAIKQPGSNTLGSCDIFIEFTST